jgi:hypothetical protein
MAVERLIRRDPQADRSPTDLAVRVADIICGRQMDPITTLSFFDGWYAHHRANCGGDGPTISFDHGSEGTTIQVVCPTCGSRISSIVSDADMPQIIQLLNPGKAS